MKTLKFSSDISSVRVLGQREATKYLQNSFCKYLANDASNVFSPLATCFDFASVAVTDTFNWVSKSGTVYVIPYQFYCDVVCSDTVEAAQASCGIQALHYEQKVKESDANETAREALRAAGVDIPAALAPVTSWVRDSVLVLDAVSHGKAASCTIELSVPALEKMAATMEDNKEAYKTYIPVVEFYWCEC